MIQITKPLLRPSLLLAALAILPACDTFDSLGLNGASSMRIEVEVYKGPLSKRLETQFAELHSKILDARIALTKLRKETELNSCASGCFAKKEVIQSEPEDTDMCAKKAVKGCFFSKKKNLLSGYTVVRLNSQTPPACIAAGRIHGKAKDRHYKICTLMKDLVQDATRLIAMAGGPVPGEFVRDNFIPASQVSSLPSPGTLPTLEECHDLNNCKAQLQYLRDASRFAEALRSRANFWAVNHIAVEPQSVRVRIEMANFAQFTADYGNQIGARADALLWQLSKGVEGNIEAAKRLATSLYLRDSDTTDYLNLYQWNKASVPPTKYRSGLDAEDRARLVERLVADTYWSKINTVHASGQGDVSMAFIKDDIGNWNLKSFTNNPEKLLDAYATAVTTVVGEVAALAVGNAPNGLKKSQQLANYAAQLAGGTVNTPATLGSADIEELHKLALQKLTDERKGFADRLSALNTTVTNLQEREVNLQAGIMSRDTEIAALKAEQDALDPVANPAQKPRFDEIDKELKEKDLDQHKDKLTLKKVEEDREKAEQSRAALPQEAEAVIGSILHDHAVIVEALQRFSTGKNAQTGAAPANRSLAKAEGQQTADAAAVKKVEQQQLRDISNY